MRHNRVKRPVRLAPGVKAAGERVATWLNRSQTASELMTAVQDLLLLGRAFDSSDDDYEAEKWEEQRERVDELLDRYSARYVSAGLEPRDFHLVLEPKSSVSKVRDDWDRLTDLKEISSGRFLDRLRRCRQELWVMYDWQPPHCRPRQDSRPCRAENPRWFFAQKDSQKFCSPECKDLYWNESRSTESEEKVEVAAASGKAKRMEPTAEQKQEIQIAREENMNDGLYRRENGIFAFRYKDRGGVVRKVHRDYGP